MSIPTNGNFLTQFYYYIYIYVRYTHLIELFFSFLIVFTLSQSDVYWENYDVLKFLVFKSRKYSSNGLNISWYHIILINSTNTIHTTQKAEKYALEAA